MIISQRTFILLFLIGVSNVLCETDFKSDVLPYLNVLACSINSKPWECVYQRSGRLFDSIDNVLVHKVNELKAEADVEYSTQLAARGLSNTEISGLDKPSTVLSSLETYVKNIISSFISTVQNDDESDEARKMKNKKKKKPQQVELVQYQKPEIYHLVEESDLGGHEHLGGLHGHHGLGGLGGHGLHKKKYGRSIGGKRGKGKKKKRRALMKILLIGAVLKAKIELLLKVIATHLQIKFFVVAVIGLIVNIARFWVDLKRGHQPQKVVYYEHAHHQHVYDEHDDGWGGSGSYWKRSLAAPADSSSAENVPNVQAADRINISYNNRPPTSIKQTAPYSPANYRTYEDYVRDSSSPQLTSYTDPHSIVYSQQMPQQTYSLN